MARPGTATMPLMGRDPKPILFHDIADGFTGRDRDTADRCPVCDAEHTTCIPEGYVPPPIPRTLPAPPGVGTPPGLPATEFEWADARDDMVRVKQDVYVTIQYPGSTREGRSLLYRKGMVVPRADAIAARAVYAEDQALHPGEVK